MSAQPKITIKQEKVSRLRLYLSLGIISIWLILGFFFFKDVGGFIEWFDELGPLSSVVYCLVVSLAIV
ncbi:MAG: hypothetical protein VYC12_05320, partial [Candidatus Thermoplasmatota archaeon]|nr:hypothetical protein [Candidatus Thermoplasmatota archaeon]